MLQQTARIKHTNSGASLAVSLIGKESAAKVTKVKPDSH